MKVFAYLRVSTKEQIEGGGYDRQLNTIEKFCADRQWFVVRGFRDQQSGGDEFADRGALQEILSLAETSAAHGVDTIVVERADRIARDLMVQEIFLRECRDRGIKVYCADSGEEIVLAGADPTRVLIRQIIGALAQWEKAQIVLKLQAGRRKKARETGKPCGGPQPYGQTDAERMVIHEIYLARKNFNTFAAIAGQLKDSGYPAPEGGLYWSIGTVRRLFNREVNYRAEVNAALQDCDQ